MVLTSNAFVSVGIPFLSTQTPSEIVTGEMGSGFFNVYRQSDYVVIDTIRNGVQRISFDVPIKNGKRITDIYKKIYIKPSTNEKNKTTISITFPTPTKYKYAQTLNNIEFTATHILALINHKISYNGKIINIPKTLCGKIGHFEIYTTQSQVLKHESYLLTKDVPLTPLAQYFRQYLNLTDVDLLISHNLIVNITHGGYIPVQTRTKITIVPEIAHEFEQMIRGYSIYIYCKCHPK